MPGDVHDDVRRAVVILDVVVHGTGTPRGLGGVRGTGDDFGKAGEEGRTGHEPGATAVVGVPVFEGVGQDHRGTQAADGRHHQTQAVLVDFEEPVGEAEVFAVDQAEDGRRSGGLAVAKLGRAPRSELPAGQVDDRASLALAGQFGQGPSRRQLHVVRVGTKSQNIHGFLKGLEGLLRHGAKVVGD